MAAIWHCSFASCSLRAAGHVSHGWEPSSEFGVAPFPEEEPHVDAGDQTESWRAALGRQAAQESDEKQWQGSGDSRLWSRVRKAHHTCMHLTSLLDLR
jgi:hypothetical protein